MKKYIVLMIFCLCSIGALAQGECPAGAWPLHMATDRSGVNHQIVCVDTQTGVLSLPLAGIVARGGTFTGSIQTVFPSFYTQVTMDDANGQAIAFYGRMHCAAIGNCMGINLVIQGWGGESGTANGYAQDQITGLGEINMIRGSFTANASMFKATVSGSPATGATSISYTPVANEGAEGRRRIFNLSRTTTGDGVTVKVTAITGNVVDFSGTNFTSADIGRGISIGNNTTLYAPTGGLCNGNDVVIDSVCVPDFDMITGVNSATEVTLEDNYDTTGLVTAMPQKFLIADMGTITGFDTSSHVFTMTANSYSWQNSDTLISPPESHGEFLGGNILMTPVYKRRGQGAPTVGYYIGSQGTQSVPLDTAFGSAGWLRYGFDFSGANFVNPARANILPDGAGIAWGTSGSYNYLDNNISETYVANSNGDANFCQYLTTFSTTDYVKTCLESGTTYTGVFLRKGGTGTDKPLYLMNKTNQSVIFGTNNVDRFAVDASGNFVPQAGAGSVGTQANPISALYATNTPKVIASGTAAMGTGAITSGTCAAAVTVAATGVLATDSITWNPNGDPTGVTGYAPSASGSLYIWAYPTADNVNFKVCNNTSGSVTPAALTLNWKVNR